MKRFEEIKKLHEDLACGHEEIDDLIQMVNILNTVNEYNNGSRLPIKIRIFMNDKTQFRGCGIIKLNDKFLKFIDEEKQIQFNINIDNINYYTIEKVGEENV